MAIIRVDNRNVVIQGHYKTRTCNTLTNIAKALEESGRFNTVALRDGYAEFECLNDEWDLLFETGGGYYATFAAYFDSGVERVELNSIHGGQPLHIFERSDDPTDMEVFDHVVYTPILKPGFEIDSVVWWNSNHPEQDAVYEDGGYAPSVIIWYADGYNIRFTTKPIIPDGYRLLDANDVGKTFGVELNPNVWIDTSVPPSMFFTVDGAEGSFTFMMAGPGSAPGAVKVAKTTGIYIDVYDGMAEEWLLDNVSTVESWTYTASITDFAGDNTWFYVADKTLTTYDISTNLTNVTADSSNPTSITDAATLTFTANAGYQLPEAVSVTNATYTWDATTGTLSLSAPTGDVSITVEGAPKPEPTHRMTRLIRETELEEATFEVMPGTTAIYEAPTGWKRATVIAEAPVIRLQEKTATKNGVVTYDTGFDGYDGLSKVTVNVPIPDGYVIPTGSVEITENGAHDVSGKASAVVNVPIPEGYSPTVTITSADALPADAADGTIAIVEVS